jgi:uncharacterized membrane protein YebE (DUF533 family)
MAFLDRLVSDVIKKSTGFNARPFVRAIGGKNMILLGGAAIAGALAIDKMQQTDSPPSANATPPPPLPPIPQQPQQAQQAPAAGHALPPLPPPIPPPQELVYAVVRTMVAAALADGEMHADEKRVIEKRLGESGLSTEQVDQIRKDLVIPAAPSELSGLVADTADREALYRFGALVVLADDVVADTEKTWLESFAAALGIAAERRQALDQELFETT